MAVSRPSQHPAHCSLNLFFLSACLSVSLSFCLSVSACVYVAMSLRVCVCLSLLPPFLHLPVQSSLVGRLDSRCGNLPFCSTPLSQDQHCLREIRQPLFRLINVEEQPRAHLQRLGVQQPVKAHHSLKLVAGPDLRPSRVYHRAAIDIPTDDAAPPGPREECKRHQALRTCSRTAWPPKQYPIAAASLTTGETFILRAPSLHPLLKRLLKGDGGAAE